MKNKLFVIVVFSTIMVKGATSTVDLLLEEYHSLCSNAIINIQIGLSGNTISNADEVYLVGWLRAQEAVPFLLDIVDYPARESLEMDATETGGAITTPHPEPPQPPALGALLLLECPLDIVTNAMVGAIGNEQRIQVLVRLGQQKFPGEFERLMYSLSSTGNPVWQQAVQQLEDDSFIRRDDWIRDRLRFFPQEVVRRYKTLFWTLRMQAEEAEQLGRDSLLFEMSEALSEIGHPFDENRNNWPW